MSHHHKIVDIVEYMKDAFLHNKHETVQKFIKKIQSPDGSVNRLNVDGDSILHSIVKMPYNSHRKKELKLRYLNGLLMHSDVEVNLPNAQKTTALHIAVEMGDMETVKALLVFGANVNAFDANYKTPLDLVEGPYRFLTRQNAAGFTIVDFDDTDDVLTSLPRPVSHTTTPRPPPPIQTSTPSKKSRPRPLLKSQPSFTDDAVPPPTHKYTSRTHSAITSYTSTFAKSGDVDVMANLLTDHGGDRGNRVVSMAVGEVRQKMYDCQFQDIIPEKSKEDLSSLSKGQEACACDDDWTTKIASLHYRISNNIERKLLDITNPLSQRPDEAMALGIQMRELKMLRDAGSRILFLDGGGMKGLVQIEILSQLEEQTGRRIAELFDWIVGASTGAIIALAIVYGKRSLRELRQFFFNIKDEVFGTGTHGMGYDTDKLEKIVKKEFGDMKMNDISHPRVIVTAVNKRTINLRLTFFNNCFGDEFSTQEVWKVARYTSGGPIYFSAMDDYVDAGVLANNPSGSGLTKIQDYYRSKGQKLPISLIVSVGTGVMPDIELGNVDVHEYLHPSKLWFNLKEKLSERTKNLISLLGSAIGEPETIAQNVSSRCREQGVEYFRFSPKLSKEISSGETDLNTLYEMILCAKNSITVSKESVDFKQLLWRFQDCAVAKRKMRTRLLRSRPS